MSRLALVSLAVATVAHAQPPGEAQPQQPQPPSVMDRRWSIHAGIGSLGLRPDRDGTDNTSFGIIDLDGRFRIRRWIDVGLSLYGGGTKGDIGTGGLYIDGRYRFLAERPWNVFALLSLGVASVSDKQATEDEKRGRGSVRIGVGVERRFRVWALDLQLRIQGIAKNKDVDTVPMTLADDLAKSKLTGGSLTLGGTFYF
jgi:hypothetical protein